MSTRPAQTRLVAASFVRGLGMVYAIAFASLWVQIIGLIGAQGILPVQELLDAAAQRWGARAALHVPCWLWITGGSDGALRALCIAGLSCSLAVVAGKLPRIALFAAWSLYLSLCAAGRVFMAYQWDALLLESGLVGLCVATPGSRLGIVLARALCFKLMLLSGIVKLTSGDPSWRGLSALSYHFWTQPLPAWSAVFVDALPGWFKSSFTAATLAIELIAPFGMFGPRRVRLAAAAALALLQVVIAATGSYGFFNILALLLCATVLDDAALLAICPARLRDRFARLVEPPPDVEPQSRAGRAGRTLHVASCVALLTASVLVSLEHFAPLPALLDEPLAALAPLRSINSYGLFAVMTTQRREIALEGSRDGVHWKRYTFAWKPDALDRRPRFATPHMPRLDWQMWFAALGSCGRAVWFHAFMARVLEGSKDVLALLASNPFPSEPPRYLRTPQAEYRFAAPGAALLHGIWWSRSPIEDFCPEVMLHDGMLVRARH